MLSTRALPVLFVIGALGGVLPAAAADDPVAGHRLVRLHADLPDTLDGTRVWELGLFDDVPAIDHVWFEAEPWGGVRAVIALERRAHGARLQRSLSPERWDQLRQQVAAGLAMGSAAETPTADALTDTMPDPLSSAPSTLWPDYRTWPEVPVPPTVKIDQPQPEAAPERYPPLGDKWLLQVGLGYQRNISSYRTFFSDQGQLNLAFARPLSQHLLFYLGVDVGFGDLQNDFEQIAGDGRGNNFGLGVGLMLRATVGRRTGFYIGGAGGYYVRSMTWGSPIYGDWDVNSYARNLEDPGFVLRAGLLLQQAHSERARFIDIGVSLQTTGAEGLHYWQDDRHFIGRDRDLWIALAVRFWDTI